MSRIAVVYGSRYGQTAKVAARIAERIAARGHEVVVERGDALPADFDLGAYDGVVVGASLIIGGYQRYIGRFVRQRRERLRGMPAAFFALSGSEGSELEAHRAEAGRIMERFLTREGWRPALRASFAGAVAYTRYHPLLRWWMKRISKAEGGSTDTTRDHEYTNWDDVARFADGFAELVERAEAERVAHASR